MPEPVGHKKRFFIGGLDNILQRIQLSIVYLDNIAFIVIDGTIGKLG